MFCIYQVPKMYQNVIVLNIKIIIALTEKCAVVSQKKIIVLQQILLTLLRSSTGPSERRNTCMLTLTGRPVNWK